MKRLILLLALLAPGAAIAGGTAEEVPTVDDAIARAKATGKPLILEFWTEWCSSCKMFEQNVLPRPEVQKALEDITFVRYDAENGNGVAAAKRYEIDRFPSFLAIDETGRSVMKEGGFGQAGPFLDFLERAAGQLVTEDSLKAQLQKTPADASLLLRAGRWYRARQRASEALTWLEAAEKADAQNERGIRADAAWEAAALRRARDLRTRIVTELADLALKYPAATSTRGALPLATIDSGLPESEVKALYAAVVAAARHGLALNQIAKLALAAGDRDSALVAAKRAVELLPKDANVWDTLAEVHHYRREPEAALAAADKALELVPAPLKSRFAGNRARFAASEFKPSGEIESMTRRVAAYWKQVGSTQLDEQPLMERPPGIEDIEEYMKYSNTLRTAFAQVGQACAEKGAGLTEAYVRVQLDENDGKPKKITVLEPDAPKALRQCLIDAIGLRTFGKPVAMMHDSRFTDKVSLQKPGAPGQGPPMIVTVHGGN